MKEKPLKSPLLICAASLKGGGGKSNIVSNLGVAFQRLGYEVALVDSDRIMKTTEQWSDDREEYIEANPKTDSKHIFTMKKNGRLGEALKELGGKFDVIIVDTGGQDSKELRSALGIVDLVITPVEPTQEALDGVDPFMELVDEIQDMRVTHGARELEVLSVISRVPPNSPKRVEAARTYLRDFDEQGLKIADNVVSARVAYPDTKEKGLAVVESKNSDHGPAKAEIEALAAEILDLMGER